jgi:hypothetical protein
LAYKLEGWSRVDHGSLDWFVGENLNRKLTMVKIPSNWSGFPVKMFPSSNSMNGWSMNIK